MPYIGYAFIVLVCLGVTLVCFNKVNPKAYPFLLYGIGAGMVLMTTLAGPHLIGSDIHLEYYYAQLRAGRDVLQPIVDIPQGTSIITYLTDNIWVYKVVYPLLFALVPVLLYFVFKKWFSTQQAFLASFLFIMFPAFSMELPSIARQMVAEVILAILLYLLIISNLRMRYKVPLVVVCGALLPLLHYAVGIIALILLGVGLISKLRRKLIGITLVVVIVTSAIYFPIAENGAIAIKLAYLYNGWISEGTIIPRISAPEIPQPQHLIPEMAETPIDIIPSAGVSFINRYEPLIKSGLGLDLLRTTIPGKIFRVLQWILIVLMVIGIWKLRRNKEYWVFAAGGLVIILLLVIPGFSSLLNVTRFLHLALFLLAPLLAVALKPKYLLIILIPYFLFTSGFIFEVTKQDSIEQITIPYSVGLSSYRMDLGASITKDDIEVRQYIYDNKLFPIYSDINGADFIVELTGWRSDLNIALRREPAEVKGFYIFVRSSNVELGTFTAWVGVGCRKYVDPREYYGIDWDRNIIFQSGNARVIKVEEE